jgi:hypothetical protein
MNEMDATKRRLLGVGLAAMLVFFFGAMAVVAATAITTMPAPQPEPEPVAVVAPPPTEVGSRPPPTTVAPQPLPTVGAPSTTAPPRADDRRERDSDQDDEGRGKPGGRDSKPRGGQSRDETS